MMDDFALLRQFVESASEEAFRALVERHGPIVRAVAVRIAGESAGDEVTQAVFIVLARKAKSLPSGTILAAWLYRTARLVALEAVRSSRRQREKHEAFQMMREEQSSDELWKQVAPVIDEAIAALAEPERAAILLRFFKGEAFCDVAGQLGISESAAKMRVSRALEKLRSYLARGGITTSSAAFAVTLQTHALAAHLPGSAHALTSAVLQSASLEPAPTALAKTALKAMAMSKTKSTTIAILAAFLLCAGGYGVYEVANPKPVVSGFTAMAGDWEGNIELRGDDLPSATTQRTAMQVHTSEDGRSCEIDMRIGIGERNEQHFRFKHALDATGRKIVTTDDPQVGLLNGPGAVTAGETNSFGLWKAGFRANHAAGNSECEWTVNGPDLKIVRHDRMAMGRGFLAPRVNRYSIVSLHRKQD